MLTPSMQTASDALPDTQTQKAAKGYKSSGTQKQPEEKEEKNGEKKRRKKKKAVTKCNRVSAINRGHSSKLPPVLQPFASAFATP